jgi:hypothetical protein
VAVEAPLPFESLDFVYTPAADVAAELGYYTTVLGGEVGWAIERFGTRVAMVRLAPGSPEVLLAEHLDGDRAVLVYRVADLDAAVAALEARGWKEHVRSGMPYGPLSVFGTPGGQPLAIYERTRPGAAAGLEGRRDF